MNCFVPKPSVSKFILYIYINTLFYIFIDPLCDFIVGLAKKERKGIKLILTYFPQSQGIFLQIFTNSLASENSKAKNPPLQRPCFHSVE